MSELDKLTQKWQQEHTIYNKCYDYGELQDSLLAEAA